MRTLLASLLAAMVLLVSASAAGARPIDSVHYAPYSDAAAAVTSTNTAAGNSSSGGTEWYVYGLIALGGLIVVGGVTYAVYTTTHRPGPHRPVGVH